MHFTRQLRARCRLAHGGVNVNQPVDYVVSRLVVERGGSVLLSGPEPTQKLITQILHSCLSNPVQPSPFSSSFISLVVAVVVVVFAPALSHFVTVSLFPCPGALLWFISHHLTVYLSFFCSPSLHETSILTTGLTVHSSSKNFFL